jgi:hypothetical protein
MIEVLGVKNAAKLVPTEDDQTPTDPVTENQNLLTGKGVKAFIEQNHQAHIQTHMAAIQNPQIQQLMQQNPQAQAIMAAAMAHINEHVGMEYRRQVEEQMGMPIPDAEHQKHMDSETADKIAVMAAQASQKLTQQAQQQAQQQAAQQQAQDPIIQMQQQELQLKMQELQLKQQKQAVDAAEKADRLRIEESRIQAQMQIAAMQVGAQSAAKRDQLEKQQQTEGVRMGIDAAKHKAQMAVQQASQRAAQQQRQQPSNKPPKESK